MRVRVYVRVLPQPDWRSGQQQHGGPWVVFCLLAANPIGSSAVARCAGGTRERGRSGMRECRGVFFLHAWHRPGAGPGPRRPVPKLYFGGKWDFLRWHCICYIAATNLWDILVGRDHGLVPRWRVVWCVFYISWSNARWKNRILRKNLSHGIVQNLH